MGSPSFRIYLSRWLLIFIITISSIFFFAGLSFIIWNILHFSTAFNSGMFFLGIFFVIITSVIITKEFFYLISPPIIFEIDSEYISIASGMNYSLTKIPTKSLKSVDVFAGSSTMQFSILGREQITRGGVEIVLNESPEVPASLATSMGISYFNRVIRIDRFYSDKSIEEAVYEIRKFL